MFASSKSVKQPQNGLACQLNYSPLVLSVTNNESSFYKRRPLAK